jgi:hypothetical protein
MGEDLNVWPPLRYTLLLKKWAPKYAKGKLQWRPEWLMSP